MADTSFETNQNKLRTASLHRIPDHAHEATRFVSQALIFSRHGKILTLKKARQKSGQAWDLPGGGVEKGESFLEAVDHELREELGLNPSGYYIPFSFSHETTKEGRQDYAVMTYLAVMRDEISPRIDMDEHVTFMWQKWGSILEPRTLRFDTFLKQDIVKHLTIEDLAAFSKSHRPLFIETQEPRQPHPSPLPSLEG